MDPMGFGGFQDDDFNYHIDFITRCANLRADNYHITNSDFHKAGERGPRGMGSKTYGYGNPIKRLLGGGFKHLLFSPLFGEDSLFD